MSNSTRMNQRNPVSAVRDLLDQLIADVPQKKQRPASQKPTTNRTSKTRSADVDRLFAYIEGQAKK